MKENIGVEFFNHLLRRKTKIAKENSRSRIEKGSSSDLERFCAIAKNLKPMEFEIFIVQPGLSPTNVSDEILTLLGVTDSFLKEVGNIDLKVIVNE